MAVATLGKVNLQCVAAQWRPEVGQCAPRARAGALRPLGAQEAVVNEIIVRDMQGWHKSAVKYASPMRLWG